MTENQEEPFWIHLPWSLLVDTTQKAEDPWQINISNILVGFLEKMRERESINYQVSGKALLTASIIHRIKSELLLRLGQRQEEKKEKEEDLDLNLPPIPMPYRLINRKVTLEELLIALERVLLGEETKKMIKKPEKEEAEVEPFIFEPSKFNIDEIIEQIFEKILFHEKEIIKFSELVDKNNPLDIVRNLLVILILVLRKKIHVWQEKIFGEIYITEAERWERMQK
ncbi:MAG: segregation/condensation protein A [Candidatus Jordarchaeum sp.]|uniref:segregation/condensation protein A n=1 Tax=Candidatus Jordarchaeum sp. TaxID=2823881 RepID=UPI00404B9CB9